MLFTAYFDESGTHADAPALVMAAYLGTFRQWEILERRLRGIQRQYGFTIFHAKEFKSKSGEFRGWSDRKRFGLLAALTELVKENLTEGASIALENERYQREYRQASRPKKMPLDSQYGICFRNVLSHLIRTVETKGKNNRLFVVVEGGHKNIGDASRIFDEIKSELQDDFGSKLLGTMAIAKKDECAPLMIADFLAYLTFSDDRGVRAGARPYPSVAPESIPKGETPWTHIRLAPNAFDLRREQFEERQRRKALKHQKGGA